METLTIPATAAPSPPQVLPQLTSTEHFRSHHPANLHFVVVIADGSVSFIRERIESEIYRRWRPSREGEVVESRLQRFGQQEDLIEKRTSKARKQDSTWRILVGKSPIAWICIALTLVVLICGTSWFLGRTANSDAQEPTDENIAANSDLVAMTFDNGITKEGDSVEHTFHWKNQ